MALRSCFRCFAAFVVAAHFLLASAAAMERIRISADGKGFALATSGTPFRVWGVNYDHDSQGEHGRLLEDYWEAEWETVESDFREMRELGANVVRIHLQVGKFMRAADQPNEAALAQLRRLLVLAESLGLYLDLTGLGCYHKADTPAWYDALPEAERWAVQARFWTAVAGACRESPAVFCYDLMNEPVVSGTRQDGWLAGELGGKHFVQRLTLEPGTRTPVEIAKAWAERLTTAIRAVDGERMITVGVIPWAQIWPGAKPIFYAPEVHGFFDFVSIHVYPKTGELSKALGALEAYEVGKPILIEETFPLSCSIAEMDEFLKSARERAEGFVSFYWGRTIAECEAAKEKPEIGRHVAAWLRYFQAQAEVMKRP